MKLFPSKSENAAEKIEPVERLIKTLKDAGVKAYENPGLWENCLCALVLSLEPKCRTYRFLEALPYQRDNLTELDVLNTLAKLGYFSRKTTMRMKSIDTRLYPVLFVDSKNIPAILISDEADKVKVFKNGEIFYLSRSQLSSKIGSAILFERYDENRQETSKFVRTATGHGWFRSLLKRFKGTFIQIFCAGLCINLISLATPLLVMLVYNRVIETGTIDVLPMIALGMVISIVCEGLLRFMRSRGLSWIAARMDNIVGNRIFAHMLSLPPLMIERASVAAQIARIKTFESIRDFFCGSVFLSIIEAPFVIFAALVIWAIAGPLVLIPLGMGVTYVCLFLIVHKKVRRSIRIAAKMSSARQQFAIEAFEKMRGIRAYGLTDVWKMKFRELSGKEMTAHFHLNFLGMAGETIAGALTVLSAVLTVSFGAHLIWTGQITTGALVATMILVWRVITPFYNMCTMIPRLEQLQHSIMQVNSLLDIEAEIKVSSFASTLSAVKGEISFTGVSLKYSDESDDVFSNLSFHAHAGDFVFITGENGAGKSSLLKLIKGLYKPSAGSIQIDGFDIRQLDAPSLRKQIAYIPQQYDYFEGSIIDNLRICNPLATRADIETALDLACAMEQIDRLPDGIDTNINRYSAALMPGNLALRLSLARLYLHTAPVLLIDEIPNAILSGAAGRNLYDYLARIKGQRTCLMVTYREDYMKMADTLVLMRRNAAPLVGAPSTLLNKITEAA